MQPAILKTAVAPYGHTRALKDGTVRSEHLILDHVEVAPIIAAFRRMIRTLEFDVSEMALSTYLCARAHGKPLTAIPIFPLRSFLHGAIVYHTASGIRGPEDLAGRRVGVRAYTVTSGVWVRGILKDEYGVDLDAVTWVTVDEEHVAEYAAPANVVRADAGNDLSQMLVAGEIDAAIGLGPVGDDAVVPLIPDAESAAAGYFNRTGVYPINHTVVVQNAQMEQRPWIATELFDLFRRSKAEYLDHLGTRAELLVQDPALALTRELVGPDPVPYGLATNRPALETMIRFAVDQKIIPRSVTVEEIFAPETLGLE